MGIRGWMGKRPPSTKQEAVAPGRLRPSAAARLATAAGLQARPAAQRAASSGPWRPRPRTYNHAHANCPPEGQQLRLVSGHAQLERGDDVPDLAPRLLRRRRVHVVLVSLGENQRAAVELRVHAWGAAAVRGAVGSGVQRRRHAGGGGWGGGRSWGGLGLCSRAHRVDLLGRGVAGDRGDRLRVAAVGGVLRAPRGGAQLGRDGVQLQVVLDVLDGCHQVVHQVGRDGRIVLAGALLDRRWLHPGRGRARGCRRGCGLS